MTRLFMVALIYLSGMHPLYANDLDAVFWTIEDRVGARFLGDTYAHNNKEKRRSLRWACTSCGHKQTLYVGLYDFEINYLTTDTEKVKAMVTRGCGFDSCITKPYARDGLTGLIQTGTKAGQLAKRTVLFIGARMLKVEVRGALTIAETDKLHMTVETAVLSELEPAR